MIDNINEDCTLEEFLNTITDEDIEEILLNNEELEKLADDYENGEIL